MKCAPLMLSAIVVAALASPSLAQVSEADRLARCQNNQARIDELQRGLDSDASYMSDEELARTRTAMMSARLIRDDTSKIMATGNFDDHDVQALWVQLRSISVGLHVRT